MTEPAQRRSEVHEVASVGFGAEAAAYDRARPSYPRPGVPLIAGVAESLPLAAASVDAVLVAQAVPVGGRPR